MELARYQVLLQLVTESKQATDGINKIKKESTGLTGVFNRAKGVFAGIVAANVVSSAISGIGGLASKSLELAKNFEQTAISFEVFTGSAEGAAKLIEDLNQFSLVTPFTPEAIQNSAKTLLGFGRTSQQVLGDLEALGNISAATGADIGGLSLVFGQVAGTGRLLGQDFNQLVNAGVPILQILSDSLGVSKDEVIALREAGELSFDVLNKAFQDATAEGGKFEGALIRQSKTIGGLFSTLQGVSDSILKSIGNAVLPLLRNILPPLIDLAFRVADAFTVVSTKIGELTAPFLELVGKAITPLRNAFSRLFSAFDSSLGITDLIQAAFNQLARSFTVVSRIVTGLVDIFASFANTSLGRGIVNVVKSIGAALLTLPAIINGVIEAVKVLPQATINQFKLLVNGIRLQLEEARSFFGAGNDALIQLLQTERDALKSVEGVTDAFKRGFNDIQNIEVTPPEIDTEENKAIAQKSGEVVGEEIGKGIKDGINKQKPEVIKTLLQLLEEQRDALRDQLATQKFTGDFLGLAITATQLEDAENNIRNFTDFLEGNARNNDGTQLLPTATSGVLGTFETYNEQLIRLRENYANASDPKLRQELEGQIESVADLLASIDPEFGASLRVTVNDDSLAKRLGITPEALEFLKTELNKSLDVTKQFVNDYLEARQEQLDGDIGRQEENVSKAQELAEKGNTDLLNSEREKLETLLNERERAIQRQRQLAAIEVAINQAVAASNSIKAISAAAAQPFPANLVAVPLVIGLLAQVGSAALAINSAFGDLPSFFDGIENTGRGNVDNRGGFHAILHPGERVVPKSINDQIGSFPNGDLADAVNLYKTFNFIPKSTLSGQSGGSVLDTSKLENKLDRLIEAQENNRIIINNDEKGLRIREEKMIQRKLRKSKSLK